MHQDCGHEIVQLCRENLTHGQRDTAKISRLCLFSFIEADWPLRANNAGKVRLSPPHVPQRK